MKHMNFIRPLPHNHKKSIRLWAVASVLLLTTLITAISILTIEDFLALNMLKKERDAAARSTSSFDTIMQRKQALKKQDQTLQEHVTLIANALKQTHHHAAVMTHIKKSLHNLAKLESFTLEPTYVNLCIDCTQTKQASEIISSLSQLPHIAGLHVRSLQPKQQGTTTALRLNVRGTVKLS